MRHLLVTNDFPPKVGGIQNYLWELWRRFPADEFSVLTRPHPGDRDFDRGEAYQIIRTRQGFLLPEPRLGREIDQVATAMNAGIVLYDPAVPVGALGPRLAHPYGVILHGAEVTVPGRLPGTRAALAKVLRNARLVVTAGEYSTAEAERAARQSLPTVEVPPGVDIDRFRPATESARLQTRRAFGISEDSQLVLSVSRLVPRKGMDVLIRAVARLAGSRPKLQLVIVGAGRDRRRLERIIAATGAPARLLGRVPDQHLPELYASADAFAMLCRTRWGGLEQEGFGIVFLEAAAAGVPQVAGQSGGAAEAVADGETGLVVDEPERVDAVAEALVELIDDRDRASEMGAMARKRAVESFSYDLLAEDLLAAIRGAGR